jgi:hypothetical protein
MTVNHILEDVQINPMMHKKATIAGGGLKQGERLPGGRTNQYLGNTMFRIDAGTRLKPDESFGIDGFIATVQTGKSRANGSAKTVPMVFSKDTGFSNDLSIFQLLKANNKVKGAGSYLYFGERNDLKFSQKTLESMLKEYPELRMEMAKEAAPILKDLLPKDGDIGYDDDGKAEETNINNFIRDMAKGIIPVHEVSSASEDVVPKDKKRSKDDVMDILSDMED